MKISIAMATYNGAKYLQEQLDSFVAQTRQPDELVVCDDASTDTTVDILENFRQQAPFAVCIYRNEKNLGYVKNFEKALSLCTGDVIFLSDQDDVWFEEKIKHVLHEFILDKMVWVIVNNAEIVYEDLKKTELTVADQLSTSGIGIEQLLLGCCIAFRSELKPLILPVPYQIHGHDGWINTLGNALYCRYFLPDVLQYYRRHGRNTSASLTTRTSPLTKWLLLKEEIKWTNIKRDPRAASERRLEQLDVLKDRIETHQGYLQRNLSSRTNIAETILKVDQERSVNQSRRSLQQLPFIKRFVAGLRFYLVGGYRQFKGWKSLARDIIR